MDRSNYPTKIKRLHDLEKDQYVKNLSPAERIEMVWQLTLQAWAFKEGLDYEPGLRRDIVRVIRRRG